MRILLRRQGGFAIIPGLASTWTLETQALPAEATAEAERLLAETNFFCLNGTLPDGLQGAADVYHYTLTVQKENASHAVHFTELTPNPPLQKLRQYVQKVGQAR